ncbi:MAG: 1-deoxy-D-xylulose-5-phosphate synthase N-terminal domain-containing protein [Halioglobus sp.]
MSDNQDWQSEVAEVAANIRKRGFGYVMANNGGYLSQICSSAEIFAYLYVRGMKLGPSIAPMIPEPFVSVPGQGRPSISGADYNGAKSPDNDRFIFSPAHYALVLYLALIESGRMAPEGLDKFNQDGGTVEMISAEHSPGAEVTTGSLAQALSVASGIAMARRMRGETGNTWVLMSDGEFQEGQTWEAVQALAAFGLDSVKVIVDVNEQQCDGPMDSVMPMGSLAAKLNAFGAAAFDVEGHDIEAFDELANRDHDGKPLFILARTNPTQGIPVLESRRPVLHYLRFSSEQEKSMFQTAYEEMVSEV